MASGTQTRASGYTNLDMTSATNPENGTVTYTYDGAHHVLSKADAMGQQTAYSWDMYGRLTAYSGASRTAFRGEAEQDSGLIPNTIPG
jgi:YD repeat-containing protein